MRAQLIQDNNVATIVYLQDIPSPEPENLQGALQALRDETQQLKQSIRSEETDSSQARSLNLPGSALQLPSRPRAQPNIATPVIGNSTIDSKAITNVGSTSDIYERIDLLKRIYEQKRAAAEAQTSQSVSPNMNGQATSLDAPAIPMASSQASPSAVPAADVQQDSVASIRENFNADRVFPKPVDLFELGNSLYQTGEIKTALDAYRQVDGSTVTASEAVWVDFMIASCHRRLGNWDEARNLYREVANQNIAIQLSKPAQSWLRQLETTSVAKSTFVQVEPQLKTLLEKAQEHVDR